MDVSNRINRLKTSPVRKLIPYGEEAKVRGIKIHHLNIGQPDIETPKEFLESIKTYSGKVLQYENSAGIKELILKVQEYYKKLGLSYDTSEILITSGGSEAIAFALLAIFDDGDEIVLGEPYYANYNSYFDVYNIKRNPIRTFAENGYHFPSRDEIEKVITPKTKAIMLSNPSNPTGVVCTKEELDNIAYLAKKYDLYVISDEVYRDFVYGENKAISFGSYKEIEDRVIIIDSISKRFSACGARIGSAISKNKTLMQAIFRQCQARLSVPTLEMIGAIGLYNLPPNYFDKALKEYEHRRDILFAEIKSMEGVVTKEPEGAFYCFAKLPVDDAEQFAIWLLKEFSIDKETIMLASGTGFYATKGFGKNEVRISYALDESSLKKAMRILREGLIEYNKKR